MTHSHQQRCYYTCTQLGHTHNLPKSEVRIANQNSFNANCHQKGDDHLLRDVVPFASNTKWGGITNFKCRARVLCLAWFFVYLLHPFLYFLHLITSCALILCCDLRQGTQLFFWGVSPPNLVHSTHCNGWDKNKEWRSSSKGRTDKINARIMSRKNKVRTSEGTPFFCSPFQNQTWKEIIRFKYKLNAAVKPTVVPSSLLMAGNTKGIPKAIF